MWIVAKSLKSSKRQKAALAEDDDPFKELEEGIENLQSIQPDLLSENLDAASFTNMDWWTLEHDLIKKLSISTCFVIKINSSCFVRAG